MRSNCTFSISGAVLRKGYRFLKPRLNLVVPGVKMKYPQNNCSIIDNIGTWVGVSVVPVVVCANI